MTPDEALRYLADPESWHGNPHDQSAWLFGHFTPYEVAREALGLFEDPEGPQGAAEHLRAVVDGESGELQNDHLLEALREEIVFAWLGNAYHDRPLHEVLHMTEAEHADWVKS